jgi:hypothetical protein
MQKSPFPGMDPFLEPHWLDVHQRLITYISDQLQDRLPSDLCSRVEERVVLEDEAGIGIQLRHPDVRVIEENQGGGVTRVLSAVAEADPSRIVVNVAADPITESYVEIVDAQTRNRVITCIELVSPTNKRPGQGREVYLEKQAECRAAGVNLVEIDLTRSGRREEIFPWLAGVSPRPTYVAGVIRATRRDRVEVHDLPLNRPLKAIRIPLRPADEDVVLELQPLIEQAYHRGRYGTIDYTRPIDPPWTSDEAAMADQILKSVSKG